LIRRLKPALVVAICRWTGCFPERIHPLLGPLARRAEGLSQTDLLDREAEVVADLTSLFTALAMNDAARGSFLP
jgi:hypothetical protein